MSPAQQKTLRSVQKQAQALQSEVTDAAVFRLGEHVTTQERVKEGLKARFLFGGNMRTDSVQVLKVRTPGSPLLVVVPWSGNVQLAHEFVSMTPGSMPGSLWLNRSLFGGMSDGVWSDSLSGEEGDLAKLASDDMKLNWATEWNWDKGKLRIKLQWVMQLTPLDPHTLIHHVQTVSGGLFTQNHRLKWYLERRQAFSRFLGQIPAHAPGQPLEYQEEPLALPFLQLLA